MSVALMTHKGQQWLRLGKRECTILDAMLEWAKATAKNSPGSSASNSFDLRNPAALSCWGVIRKSLNCQHTWDYSGCKVYRSPLAYRHRACFSLPLRQRHLCLGHRHRR